MRRSTWALLFAALIALSALAAFADSITVRLDAWHAGHCICCGEVDYSCTEGTHAPIGPVTFDDPLPPGALAQRLTIKTYGMKCESVVQVSLRLNGRTIASGDDPGPDACTCGGCAPNEYTSAFYTHGVPGWIYGRANTLLPVFDGTYCLAYIELTIEYIDVVIGTCGVAGFLDRGWPEAAGGGGGLEEPPRVGELLVSSVYEVGEVITGCVSVTNGIGEPITDAYFPLAFYTVTVGEEFDVREAIHAELVRCLDPGSYCFDLETDELDPGYYDIRLGLPDGRVEWIRVELIAALE